MSVIPNAHSPQRAARIALGLLAAACLAFAQPMPSGQGTRNNQETLVSPEVHADHTVTFRLYAPKATEVTVTGDWMATLEARTGGTTKMTKGSDGV